jgi:tetratricopeptide (TPR) repeat protein
MERFDEAESELLEIIATTRNHNAKLLEGMAISTLANLYIETKRIQQAVEHYRVAYDIFQGTIPVVEASVGMSLCVALARAGSTDELNALDHLTLNRDQYVEGMPRDQMWHLRNLAEVRFAQGEPAAAYRHIGRAREVAKKIEGGPNPKIVTELNELERRILGKT